MACDEKIDIDEDRVRLAVNGKVRFEVREVGGRIQLSTWNYNANGVVTNFSFVAVEPLTAYDLMKKLDSYLSGL